ncbi:MAG: class I SAM-dependent methyltransferase, partial [Gammaproteobacteria bacterium]|nr:class I SAM-dependent methyltransferase [Gammaproteobacteria bacterium]
LFGVKEDGPIRIAAHELGTIRIKAALQNGKGKEKLSILEAGCGGTPAAFLFDLCSHYTGVDFSDTGIKSANKILVNTNMPYSLRESDITNLPFADATFEAAYSAHVIYHIDEPTGQAKAFAEIMRVLKPSANAVFILSNPRPFAFPVRAFKRIVADTPILSSLANRLRSAPHIPYKPMTLGWMHRELKQYGEVSIICHAIPSNNFYQNITEFRGVGKVLWKTILWLQREFPRLSARLGNYVQISVKKF